MKKKANGKGFRKNLSRIVSESSSEEEIVEEEIFTEEEVRDNDGGVGNLIDDDAGEDDYDDDDNVDVDVRVDGDADVRVDGDGNSVGSGRIFEAPSKDTYMQYLTDLWNIFNLSVNKDDIVNKYFGTIFCNRKNNEHLFVGRAEKLFINEEQQVVSAIQLNCLKKKHGTSNNILEEYLIHLSGDIDVFPVWNIITPPLKMIPKTSGKLEFPGYQDVLKTFQNVKSSPKEEIYNKFICRLRNSED